MKYRSLSSVTKNQSVDPLRGLTQRKCRFWPVVLITRFVKNPTGHIKSRWDSECLWIWLSPLAGKVFEEMSQEPGVRSLTKRLKPRFRPSVGKARDPRKLVLSQLAEHYTNFPPLTFRTATTAGRGAALGVLLGQFEPSGTLRSCIKGSPEVVCMAN